MLLVVIASMAGLGVDAPDPVALAAIPARKDDTYG
jgi:hypothetical protein